MDLRGHISVVPIRLRKKRQSKSREKPLLFGTAAGVDFSGIKENLFPKWALRTDLGIYEEFRQNFIY
jgi:hypothetical protein